MLKVPLAGTGVAAATGGLSKTIASSATVTEGIAFFRGKRTQASLEWPLFQRLVIDNDDIISDDAVPAIDRMALSIEFATSKATASARFRSPRSR